MSAQAQQVAGSKKDIASKNKAGTVPAAVNGPKGCKGGVVVIQEWWGLNQQIQDVGQEISQMGPYMTVVPDLYRGKVATDNETAGHYMNDLDWPGAIDDIRGCVQELKKMGCKKVAVTGFCMGGALSLAAAALIEEVDAAVPFYGIPGASLCDVTKIKVPVQCHFGSEDEVAGFSDPPSQKTLQENLKKGGVPFDFFEYKGAKHAFTNTTGANHNPEARKESFRRMSEFFKKHL